MTNLGVPGCARGGVPGNLDIMNDVKNLHEILAPVVEQTGLYLEEVELKPAGKRTLMRVTVDLGDGPGGVDSDLLGDVTRAVSAALDKSPAAPKGQYVLEVTTPGATRKLTTPRHYRRAEGRIVIVTTDSGQLRGRVESVGDDTLTISTDGQSEEIAFSDIVSARMDVEL